MDQMTPFEIGETHGRRGTRRGLISWFVGLVAVPTALVGALALGLRAGEARWPLPAWLPTPVAALLVGDRAGSQTDAPVLYYRDPDKALYAPTPIKTPDGRDYRAAARVLRTTILAPGTHQLAERRDSGLAERKRVV